ncbi:LysE family transporter [Runella sp.]|jgi:threonine/homoserine/homoserine lactone efflux protein|uniref:LysE family translocator n=1 Tax=Runella sp. TaxID=1960881 RepID=UPI00260CCC10|nr:LysE family transporter [Runella sp.]
MFLAALYGLIAGILLCLTFGTVFFSLIQTSVERGYRSGIQISLGVVASDAFFCFTAIFGTSFLPRIEHFNQWIGAAGIVFLAILGIKNFMKVPTIKVKQYDDDRSRRFENFKYFLKGLALNALNPVNFMSWAAIAAYLRTKGRYDLNEMILFFGMSLIGVFITQSALAIYAHRLRSLLTIRVMRYINILTGVVFLVVAGKLLWEQFLK